MSKEVSEEEEKERNIRTWLICKINTTNTQKTVHIEESEEGVKNSKRKLGTK